MTSAEAGLEKSALVGFGDDFGVDEVTGVNSNDEFGDDNVDDADGVELRRQAEDSELAEKSS